MHESARYIPKALFRPRVKPFVIWASPPFLVAQAVLDAYFIIAVAMDEGSFSFGSQTISRAQFLLIVVPLALFGSAWGLASAYGLFFEQPWTRALCTKWSGIAAAASITILSATSLQAKWLIVESWQGALTLAASFWYFYRYEPVVRYYDHLARKTHRK